MPIASWRRRCSRMGSGKRASMREGPLAALFRRTEEAQEAAQTAPPEPTPEREAEAPPAPEAEAQPAAEIQERPAPRTPTPQERLRHAFSSDLPDNMMSPPPAPPASSSEYQWASASPDIT